MQDQSLSYTQTMQELEAIVQGLEHEQQDIDTLSQRIERANQLLAFCRERLTQVSNNVQQALGDEQK